MKTSLTFLALSLSLILTSTLAGAQAFAAVQSKYFEECKAVAMSKLQSEAQSAHLDLLLDTIEVEAQSGHWYSLSRYLWFTIQAVDDAGETEVLHALVQKPLHPRGACF